jgi:hypothetical protein
MLKTTVIAFGLVLAWASQAMPFTQYDSAISKPVWDVAQAG